MKIPKFKQQGEILSLNHKTNNGKSNVLIQLLLICCLMLPKLSLANFVMQDTSKHQVSKVWVADKGNGMYQNPILHADYSDPDAVRVGDDYYMVSSSFNCMPGLPILHSRDLVNWKVINYALKKQEPEGLYSQPQHGKGVWAPCMRYHNGEFYIYYPDPDFGIYMIKTKNAFKDWEKPVLVLAGKGIIDPAPLWDNDGKAYLAVAWAGSRAGMNSLITVFKMNAAGTKVTDEGKHVFDGHDHQKTIEGPKFYKFNNYYYILSPADGVGTGWQLALRSKNVYGPYEEKIVLDQGKTSINGPHQGALVSTQTGEYWFLHFQDKGAYGRIIHLQPVKWVNNWPVIGIDADRDGKGEPVLSYKKPNVGKVYPINTPAESDEFNNDTLGLQWQWQANPKVTWSALMKGTGYLRLFAFPLEKGAVNLWPAANLLLQKFPAPDFKVTTKLSYTTEFGAWEGKKAGLIIMGNDYAYIAISKNAKGFAISQAVCKNAADNTPEDILEEQPINRSSVYLRVTVSAPNARCQFSYSEDGKDFKDIGKSFLAKPDKWIGAKTGIFCIDNSNVRTGGYADFDWFRVTK